MASFRERPPRFLLGGITPENNTYLGYPLLCLSNKGVAGNQGRLPAIQARVSLTSRDYVW
jgi:hypothetical protein